MGADRVPPRDDLAGVEPYGAPQLAVAVRLNTNETPYAPPPAYFDRLSKRIGDLDLHRYPDRRISGLRTALGERFGLPLERVWVASGSNEVLLQLFQAYGGPGRTLLLPSPGYSAHPLIARAASTAVRFFPLDEAFELTPAAAAEHAAASNAHLICIASPNNPTGIPVSLDAVRALHDASKALVIVDEAYVEFAGADASAVSLLDELPRLVVCRTFSKAWRVAGVRLGYLLAHDWVIEDVRKVRLPYHVDSLTQEAGLAAIELADEMTAHIPEIVAERQRLTDALRRFGALRVLPSAANFVLFGTDVEDLFDRLFSRGVLVRDFSDQPGLSGTWLRVTVGTAAENEAFLTALEESLT